MCKDDCKLAHELHFRQRTFKCDESVELKTPTHQETTDRINALACALGELNGLRTMRTDKGMSPINKAIEDIAKEISKLTTQD